MNRQRTAAKGAELVSGLGAIVLGMGLSLVLPAWLRSFALPLLIVGALAHGAGMTLKYRFEARQTAPSRWERGLFWLCWAGLAGVGIWTAMAAPA